MLTMVLRWSKKRQKRANITKVWFLTDFLVESSPVLKRKCADEREYKDDGACQDVLDGQMSMLACYCEHDLCNIATTSASTATFSMLSLLILVIIQ